MSGFRRGMLLGATAGLMLLVCGCAGNPSASVDDWQRGVEDYIQHEGNGDPNILRDVTLAGSQKGFALLGANDVDESADANGVLVGRRTAGGQKWFVYLVGIVEEGDVRDIRLAAMSADGVGFHWLVSDADPQALAQYREYRQRGGATYGAGPGRIGFPARNDDFQLSVAGEQITVTHQGSGAHWAAVTTGRLASR